MNTASVLIAIPVAALLIWALIRTIKSRGKCSGCSGNCSECQQGHPETGYQSDIGGKK